METRQLVDQGLGVTVGDGKKTSFWEQRWVDDIKLMDHVQQEIPAEHLNKRVCDYWQPNIGWDWETLAQFIPPELLKR